MGKRNARLYTSQVTLCMDLMRHSKRATDCAIADASNQPPYEDGRDPFITLGGVVSNLQRKFTGAEMRWLYSILKIFSSIEVTVFPRTMAEHGHQLDDDAVLLVSGRIDTRDDEPKFIANKLNYFEVKTGPLNCG